MVYTLTLKVEAFHEASQAWYTRETTQELRAVSRRHACDKGIRIVHGWPDYQDRERRAEWTRLSAEATIIAPTVGR